MNPTQDTQTNQNTNANSTVRDWRGLLYRIDGSANSQHVDMTAYLMHHRFDFDPSTHTGEKEATKWLMRVQSGSHWGMADGDTTRVLIDYLQSMRVPVEYTGDDS